MHPNDFIQAARLRAAELPRSSQEPVARLDALRGHVHALFRRVPEPPVYRRADDPSRRNAEAMLAEASPLLTEAFSLLEEPRVTQGARDVLELLHPLVEALAHTSDGRLALADEAWQRSQRIEEAQHPTRRFLGTRGPRARAFEKASGKSRYDPASAAIVSVRLVCPNTGCKRLGDYGFQATHAQHRFECAACKTPFVGFFAELEALAVDTLRSARRFHFRVMELGAGAGVQIDFEEASGVEFSAARKDLLVFLYTDARELKSVMNLTNHRMMWVSPAGACFIATAVFGEGAEELAVFRAFRDDTLRKAALGRAFIRGYYRAGPSLARRLETRPALRRAVRRGLVQLHDILKRSSARE